MSAAAGWYPDPGGGPGLYRYWDGRAWSAATSANPGAAAPLQGLPGAPSASGTTWTPQNYGSTGEGTAGSAYAQYQQVRRKRSPVGWWLAGAAILVVLVVLAVVAVRAVSGGDGGETSGLPGGAESGDVCPPERPDTSGTAAPPARDGRVHGGPVSYPVLGSPWSSPQTDDRVPFGVDVQTQTVTVEPDYQPGASWVASVLVGELQAGDGFFTPEQGSQIVVRCILGRFYGNNPVTSDVKVNQAATIDGHEAWVVESQLSFDIAGLETKGERLIVAIVASSEESSGLYYASIPDTTPELLKPARQALEQLKVDG